MGRSKLSDRRARHDPFHRRAKREGFASRAVFKLEEIDRKLQLFQRGQRVLDLGCAPGSWLQYAGSKIGRHGAVVGLDRFEVSIEGPNSRCLVGDVHSVAASELLGDLECFDVVLSDMAPDTTGVRNVDQARSEQLFATALDIAQQTLGPGGHFVGKLFQGPEFQGLLQRCRRDFESVKVIKPSGSRKESIEQYICGLRYRGGES